jgi:hypothetical protein
MVLVLQKQSYMTQNRNLKNVFLKLITLISALLLAFGEQDRFMELVRYTNGREYAKFRSTDNNVIIGLNAGTQGEIIERVFFKQTTKNWGIKIRVLNGENKGQEYWVYYTAINPNMKFSMSAPEIKVTVTPTPENAVAAELTKNQRSIKITPVLTIKKSDSTTLTPINISPINTIPDQVPSSSDEVDSKMAVEVARMIPEKVEQAQESVSQLTSPKESKHCSSCEYQIPKSCTENNSYFEEDLLDLQNNSSEFLQNLIEPIDSGYGAKGINYKCVRASLESFPPKRFKNCIPNESNRLVIEKAKKPCVTSRLVSTLTKSFNITAKCLRPIINKKGDYNYKLQKIFEMISLESGFHTNVVGTNDDAGIGQLQSSAGAAVNRIILDEAKVSLRESSDSDCQKLYSEFLKEDEPIRPSRTCDRISVKKGNPWKNMIYTFLYFKVNRDIMDDLIFNQQYYSNRLSLSTTELEKLKDEMAKLAHNKGAGGASDLLSDQIINHFNSSFPAQSAGEVLRLLDSMKNNYLKKSSAQAERIKNLAHLSQENSCIKPF